MKSNLRRTILLCTTAMLVAGFGLTSGASLALAQEATFALPAGELGATSYNPVTSSNLNSATSLIFDRLVEQDADQSSIRIWRNPGKKRRTA